MSPQFGNDLIAGEALDDVDNRRAADHAYWRERLEGCAPRVETPLERWVAGRSERRVIRRSLGPASVRRLDALARGDEATVQAILVATLAVVLSRYAVLEDVVIGVPNAPHDLGRDALDGAGDLVPLRIHVDETMPFESLVDQVHAVDADARPHATFAREVGSDALPAALASDRMPFVHALLRVEAALGRKLSSEQSLPDEAECLDMELVYDSSDQSVRMSYLTHFDDQAMESFASAFEHVIEGLSDGSLPIEDLALLSDDAQQLAIADLAGDAVSDLEDSCWNLFEAAAARHPNNVAIVEGDQRISYDVLHARAERLAGALRSAGVGRDDVVALHVERGIECAVSILAVLRAGAGFLPLGLSWPVGYRQELLARSGARWLIACPDGLESAAVVARVGPVSVVGTDAFSESAAPPADADAEDLAYVLFTSGTTGEPKGAMVEMGGLVNHLRAKVGDLALVPTDVVAQSAPLSFNIAIWQYLATLSVGAQVVVLPDDVLADPARLVDELDDAGVTVWEAVPAVISRCLERLAVTGRSLPALRIGVATGEPLPPELARTWFTHFPESPLVNAYGQTECSDDVAHNVLTSPPPPAARRVSVGRAVRGASLAIVDRQGRPVPHGFPGELMVAGIPVGRGYVNDAARTGQTFRVDPRFGNPAPRTYRTGDLARRASDGTIEVLGRIDDQIKVNGVRIEPTGIECSIGEHPSVALAAVRSWEGRSGARFLCAYLVPRDDAGIDVAAVRRHLAERLPRYFVPSVWLVVEDIPLNTNGKLNRSALPRPDQAGAGDTRAGHSGSLESRREAR